MSEPVIAANETNGTSNGTAIRIQDSVLAYSNLYMMALLCIYLGACRSVSFVRKHRMEDKKIENSITTKEAKMFPLTASGVLFSLYVIFKYNHELHNVVDLVLSYVRTPKIEAELTEGALNATNATTGGLRQLLSKENFSYGLMVLLVYNGVFAMAHLIKPFLSRLIRLLPLKEHSELKENLPYQFLFTKAKSKGSHERSELLNIEFDTHDLVSVALCSLVGLGHVIKRHWLTNNAIGLCFCIYGIEALHLSSFKGGVWLLAGLFVYDIFWVFATDVMTTVATSISAPILLMFPQDILTNRLQASKFAMLGLGDIVIPGIFLALLLRFDSGENETHQGAAEGSDDSEKPVPPTQPRTSRLYFYVTLGSYALGLFLTIGVMHWFKAAQPALLYLVPACVGAPCFLAVIRGEFQELINYSEEHLVQKDDEKGKEEEGESKKTN